MSIAVQWLRKTGFCGCMLPTRVRNFLSEFYKPVALVVEDEPLLALYAEDLLCDLGYEVHHAHNADVAVPMLQTLKIDLLFTDIEMPGRWNGLALAVHAATVMPEVPILVVSGRLKPAQTEIPSSALFFSKPYDASHITQALRLFRKPA
ncbi:MULTISPECIES: response regulator [unclassified Rhizobium]|uniref:response regulator n=1 Tax=unclassified Rhizobium TaxID=2613769 RepID=UPI0013599EA6|nr:MULTISPECIES: response regulator [unclassified Rhizobium]